MLEEPIGAKELLNRRVDVSHLISGKWFELNEKEHIGIDQIARFIEDNVSSREVIITVFDQKFWGWDTHDYNLKDLKAWASIGSRYETSPLRKPPEARCIWENVGPFENGFVESVRGNFMAKDVKSVRPTETIQRIESVIGKGKKTEKPCGGLIEKIVETLNELEERNIVKKVGKKRYSLTSRATELVRLGLLRVEYEDLMIAKSYEIKTDEESRTKPHHSLFARKTVKFSMITRLI